MGYIKKMDIHNSIKSRQPALVADIAMEYLCGLSGSDSLLNEPTTRQFVGANLTQIISSTPQVVYVESDREQLVNDYLMSQSLTNGAGTGVRFGVFAPKRDTDYIASMYSCLSGISRSKIIKNHLNNAEVEHISTEAQEAVSSFIDNNALMYLNGVMSINDIDRYLSTSDVDVLIISAGITECMSDEDLELLQFSALLYETKIVVGFERQSKSSLRCKNAISNSQSTHIRLDLVEGYNVLCEVKLAGSFELSVKGAWDFDCHRLAFLN